MADKLKVLSSDHCPVCQDVKKAIKEHGVDGYDVQLLRIEDDKECDEIIKLMRKHPGISYFPIAVKENGEGTGEVCNVRVEKEGKISLQCGS